VTRDHYLWIAAIVLAAAAIRQPLDSFLADKATLLAFPAAIAGAAWLGGYAGGFFATGLSVLVGTVLFAPGGLPAGLSAPGEVARAWLFIAQGLLITGVVGALVEGRQSLRNAIAAERLAHKATAAAIQQRDHVLAIASHELRTPLNVILGWSTQLRRMDLPPSQRRAIEIIHRNAQAEANVIEDLLDAATGYAGELVVDRAAFDLSALVHTVAERAQALATERGVQMQLELEDRPRYVLGDQRRFQHALYKIVQNAVKFTPVGGTVSIRSHTRAHALEIVVEDSGVGIAPEMLPHVFDRFRVRGAQGRGEYASGLGLSLSIAKDLIERHGGTVSAASAGVGRGASFTVTCPIALQAVTPTQTLPLDGMSASNQH
jgi:signal transduction histidine kinase